jgi:hypothetical protein
MSEFLFFLAVGIGSVALLLIWLMRTVFPRVDKTGLHKAQVILTTVEVELPPRALGERIFSEEDWNFISNCTAPGIQRIFLEERKALALSWLKQTRKRVGQIMTFHRIAVRQDVQLSPTLEVRLAVDYLLFVFSYNFLYALIWLRGPFFARGIISYVAGIADQLSYVSGQMLLDLDPIRLGKIKDRWSSRVAA